MGLTKTTVAVNNITALSDTPNATEGLTAAQLKAKFDKTGSDLKTYINDTLITELDTLHGAVTSADLAKLHAVTADATELNYVDGVTSAIQTQMDTKLGWAGTIVASLADDAAMSVVPPAQLGMVFIQPRGTTYAEIVGIGVYRCTSTNVFRKTIFAGEKFVMTTGALAGTTGTDGKFTVSCHSDGKIYFENRLGIAVSFTYIFMGS